MEAEWDVMDERKSRCIADFQNGLFRSEEIYFLFRRTDGSEGRVTIGVEDRWLGASRWEGMGTVRHLTDDEYSSFAKYMQDNGVDAYEVNQFEDYRLKRDRSITDYLPFVHCLIDGKISFRFYDPDEIDAYRENLFPDYYIKKDKVITEYLYLHCTKDEIYSFRFYEPDPEKEKGKRYADLIDVFTSIVESGEFTIDE